MSKPTKNTRHSVTPHSVMPTSEGAPVLRIASTLLTPEEESALVSRLAKAREDLEKAISPFIAKSLPDEKAKLDHFDQRFAYFRTLTSVPAKTRRRIERLVDEYNEIKHHLVVANLPWVTKLARNHRQSVVAEEDYFQEGVCGLLKAIDRFEPARGLRLMTYATWYIREAMQQIRAKQSHLVSLSAHDQTLLGKIESMRNSYLHTHERLPSEKEMGKAFHASKNTITRLQAVLSPAVSLERSGQTGTIPVPVDDATEDVDTADEVATEVMKLLDSLTARERIVVTRRFGLDGSEPTSLEALGANLNVSKERVRQIQRQALQRMREAAHGLSCLDSVAV